MAEIECPHCHTVFTVDETEYQNIAKQVRDAEFKREVGERQKLMEADKRQTAQLAVEQTRREMQQALADAQAQLAELKAQLDAKDQQASQQLEAARAQAAQRLEAARAQAASDKAQAAAALKAAKEQASADAQAQAASAQAERAKLEAQVKAAQDAAALSAKDATVEAQAEIARLKAQLENQQQASEAQKQLALEQAARVAKDEQAKANEQLVQMKAQITAQRQAFDAEKALAVEQAAKTAEAARHQLEMDLAAAKTQAAQREAMLKEQSAEQLRNKDEVIKYREQEIERLRDMKSRLSTKMLGETLEQHCENEFNRARAMAFPYAYFEKDNEILEHGKGDYIFRDFDGPESEDDRMEVVSIMFDMKNEGDTENAKVKNEHYFKKLDQNRTEHHCEYAVLVSTLEPDSDLYNAGIVDVSHRYPKMYVIRPQFFLPLISLLRNANLKALDARRELSLVRQQNIDITHFEDDLDQFKGGFFKSFKLASDRFDDAIAQIDKSIAMLQKVRDNLTKSENHLQAANNKLEGLTIKKLTRKNPTMKAKFDELQEGRADDAGGGEGA